MTEQKKVGNQGKKVPIPKTKKVKKPRVRKPRPIATPDKDKTGRQVVIEMVDQLDRTIGRSDLAIRKFRAENQSVRRLVMAKAKLTEVSKNLKPYLG